MPTKRREREDEEWIDTEGGKTAFNMSKDEVERRRGKRHLGT